MSYYGELGSYHDGHLGAPAFGRILAELESRGVSASWCLDCESARKTVNWLRKQSGLDEVTGVTVASLAELEMRKMFKLKKGVMLDKVQPQMVVAAMVVCSIYEEAGYDCTITSGNDGVHSTGSLHYRGLALDFRTRNVPEDLRDDLQRAVQVALNGEASNFVGDYDVVLEKTHLHVEYDPQR